MSLALKMKEWLMLKMFGRDIKICKTVRKFESFMKSNKKMLDFLSVVRPISKFPFMILKIGQMILFGRKTKKWNISFDIVWIKLEQILWISSRLNSSWNFWIRQSINILFETYEIRKTVHYFCVFSDHFKSFIAQNFSHNSTILKFEFRFSLKEHV